MPAGAPEDLGPSIKGVAALGNEAKKIVGGTMALTDLRKIPLLASVLVVTPGIHLTGKVGQLQRVAGQEPGVGPHLPERP